MGIKCLECGKQYVRPLSHVWQVHKLTAREYKELNGLDVKKGIATEEYREKMRAHIKENEETMRDNFARGALYRFKKGETNNYKRSAQTQARLIEHWNRVARRDGRPVTIEKVKITCAICSTIKEIYPRSLKERNYCGVRCRNIQNNMNRKQSSN